MVCGHEVFMSNLIPYGYRFNKKTKKLESKVNLPEFTYNFPEGFVVVCDTREQSPLFIPKPPKGLIIVRDTLRFGDYSIKGFENSIAIERKTIQDLWTSLTSEAKRFKAELEELAKYERRYILIEGLESEYLSWQPERKIHPNAIRMALASIEAKGGIPIHQAENREMAERWVLDLFIKYFLFKRGV